MRSSSDGPRGVWQQGACGGGSSANITLCIYCACVCVWVWGRRSEEKVCVCGEQNKQNLYSLNRMTLYKFSCAAMGLQVCVCGCVYECIGVNVCSPCVCKCVRVGGSWAHTETGWQKLCSICADCVWTVRMYLYLCLYLCT